MYSILNYVYTVNLIAIFKFGFQKTIHLTFFFFHFNEPDYILFSSEKNRFLKRLTSAIFTFICLLSSIYLSSSLESLHSYFFDQSIFFYLKSKHLFILETAAFMLGYFSLLLVSCIFDNCFFHSQLLSLSLSLLMYALSRLIFEICC